MTGTNLKQATGVAEVKDLETPDSMAYKSEDGSNYSFVKVSELGLQS